MIGENKRALPMRILCVLEAGPLHLGELAVATGKGPNAVSGALTVLARAGYVRASEGRTRQGRTYRFVCFPDHCGGQGPTRRQLEAEHGLKLAAVERAVVRRAPRTPPPYRRGLVGWGGWRA